MSETETSFAITQSLCPVCLARIPARKVIQGGSVYLEKSCPQHGDFKVLIWKDARLYQEWGKGQVSTKLIKKRLTAIDRGCPYDCGLCPNHEGETCTVLMEITKRCDIRCRVCFADANVHETKDPTIDEIEGMLSTVLETSGACPVQLSGGEPTLRDDLPTIAALAKNLGFEHVQINTHGLRIAKDREYLRELKDAGVDLIYLQFDGLSDDVYQAIRNTNLLRLKLRAIENCAESKMGVILVPTVIPGTNDHQLNDIIQFAKKWIPLVKGVHFQPISYFGRYPCVPRDVDRITIPDILKALESQSAGELKMNDFVPRRRRDPHCGFSAFYVLMENGRLQATTSFRFGQSPVLGSGCLKESPAEHVRRFISQRQKFAEERPEQTPAQPNYWQSFFHRAKTHFLSVSGMPFQDVWTVELGRLQGCCIHVITRDRRLVPFCAFYLTSVTGERLHKDVP